MLPIDDSSKEVRDARRLIIGPGKDARADDAVFGFADDQPGGQQCKGSKDLGPESFQAIGESLMVGCASLFASVLGLVTKNIEQHCEKRLRSSHFLSFSEIKSRKPQTDRACANYDC